MYLPKFRGRHENLFDSARNRLYGRKKLFTLKRIKSEKRSTVDEEKLNSLISLSTQSDIRLKMDLIDDFGRVRTRKKPILLSY